MLRSIGLCDVCAKGKLFTILVVLMPLFHVYKPSFISISYGEILLFVCIPLYFKQKMNFPLDRQEIGFVIFFFYMMISSMIMGIAFDAPMSKYFSIARASFYWVLIFYFGKNLFNRILFEKWMIVFSVALSVFILVQFFAYTLTKFYIPGLILSLPLNDGGVTCLEMYEHSLKLASWRGFIRPSGFLAEPAHCCEFFFISIITLICEKTILFKKKFLLILLFSVAICATQSTTGIILLSLAWFLFMSIEKRLYVYRLPLVLSILAIGFYVIFNGYGSTISSIDRVINIVNDYEIDGSSNVQLYNSIFFYPWNIKNRIV